MRKPGKANALHTSVPSAKAASMPRAVSPASSSGSPAANTAAVTAREEAQVAGCVATASANGSRRGRGGREERREQEGGGARTDFNGPLLHFNGERGEEEEEGVREEGRARHWTAPRRWCWLVVSHAVTGFPRPTR